MPLLGYEEGSIRTASSRARHEPLLSRLRQLFANAWYLCVFLVNFLYHWKEPYSAYQANYERLRERAWDVIRRSWDLGFTSFGGPPVHFQTFHRRFVQDGSGMIPWINEETYQELFGVCQSLPGSSSTKMVFCITLIHTGLVPALMVFLIWSLPGAFGMLGLSLGVQKMNEKLPPPIYALLSGMNAATVGVIAVAAVELSKKAIRDRLTRVLVLFGASAGLLYSALWYFPIPMCIGGMSTALWDCFLRDWSKEKRAGLKLRFATKKERKSTVSSADSAFEKPTYDSSSSTKSADEPILPIHKDHLGPDKSATTSFSSREITQPDRLDKRYSKIIEVVREVPGGLDLMDVENLTALPEYPGSHAIPIKWGVTIIVVFFITFATVLITRSMLPKPSRALDLFADMYMAGTVIFGGGPVVIPLLRSYVVDPGWVTPRDFLLGLAIIQAFPGPNFNFAVYLGALTMRDIPFGNPLGAAIAFVGIYLPGTILALGVQSFWRVLRTRRSVLSFLRGINATAAGLVFTAVYRLWQIGFLTESANRGISLAEDPWWCVVAGVAYVGNAWFSLPPAGAIVVGAGLGLCWFGVTAHTQTSVIG